MTGFLARLQVHPVAGAILISIAILLIVAVAVGIVSACRRIPGWWHGLRYARRSRRARREALSARRTVNNVRGRLGTPSAPDPFWGEDATSQHDTVWDQGLTGEFAPAPVPDCAEDCQTMTHSGPMPAIDPLSDPSGHWAREARRLEPLGAGWDGRQSRRPVETVNMPPWETEAAEGPPIRGDDQGWADRVGRGQLPAGGHSRSDSLSPRSHRESTTPASVTAGRATTDLPGPVVPDGLPASGPTIRARKLRRRKPWSGLFGAPDPQTLPGPVASTLALSRDREPGGDFPAQDGRYAGTDPSASDTGVLSGEVVQPPAPDDGAEPPTVVVNILNVTISAGSGYLTDTWLQDQMAALRAWSDSGQQELRAWRDEPLALEAAS